MTFSTDEIEGFEEQWAVIRRFSSLSSREWMTSGGVLVSEGAPPEAFYNLPVVLAFSLLDEVLGALAAQGAFPVGRGAMLGAKMDASQNAIPWNDYASIHAAKERRNELAHRGLLIPKSDCLEMVDAISAELKKWRAIRP
jgi:hypothetical protein